MFSKISPEKAGISSKNIANFINTLNSYNINTHSIIMAKGNNIIAESYYEPFGKDILHRMYSVSKSFVAIAIGLAEQEGLLSLDDKFIYYFPEYQNENTDTIALFCHFGLGTSIISHVLNMPLIPVWNSVFLPTSSVTTLYFEKHIDSRQIAHGIFAGIGDTSHLFAGDEPISCSGLHTKTLK